MSTEEQYTEMNPASHFPASMPHDLPLQCQVFLWRNSRALQQRLRDEDEMLGVSKETSISSQFLFPLMRSTYIIRVALGSVLSSDSDHFFNILN